jgi:pyruvate,water dikinase
MTDVIRSFSEINKGDAAIAGGKGASLGELTQAKIPVPPGFVIVASAFRQFIQEAGIGPEIESQLQRVNVHDTNSVEQASERIRALFKAVVMPEKFSSAIEQSFDELAAEFVAVRSSATAEDSSAASWAGELETYLYTKKSTLVEHVKKCWSSLYTPRAIFYRAEKLGLPGQSSLTSGDGRGPTPEVPRTGDHVAVAVVIQAMVASEVSGVCFTVHPVTKDPNQLIIEAGWGLGEAIVGGLITPDSYIVDKTDGTIIDTYISEQSIKIVRKPEGGTEEVEVNPDDRERQKLSHDRVIELAKLAQQIEQHYRKPQDIEWALADGQLFILQSRPITTL